MHCTFSFTTVFELHSAPHLPFFSNTKSIPQSYTSNHPSVVKLQHWSCSSTCRPYVSIRLFRNDIIRFKLFSKLTFHQLPGCAAAFSFATKIVGLLALLLKTFKCKALDKDRKVDRVKKRKHIYATCEL